MPLNKKRKAKANKKKFKEHEFMNVCSGEGCCKFWKAPLLLTWRLASELSLSREGKLIRRRVEKWCLIKRQTKFVGKVGGESLLSCLHLHTRRARGTWLQWKSSSPSRIPKLLSSQVSAGESTLKQCGMILHLFTLIIMLYRALWLLLFVCSDGWKIFRLYGAFEQRAGKSLNCQEYFASPRRSGEKNFRCDRL